MLRHIKHAWLILLCVFASVTSSQAEEITKYHTTITVLPSGSLQIGEEILYDFGSLHKHGIFRDIPLSVKSDQYAKETPVGLTDISTTMDGRIVDVQSKTLDSQTSGKMLRLKIGDPKNTVTGKHLYIIKYNVKRGVYPSHLSGMEAIRWNAIGSGSSVPTRLAIADLILPHSLNRSDIRINVYTGSYGSKDSNARYDWVSDRHIRFTSQGLAPHVALTVEANYPRGALLQSADLLKSSWLDRLLASWHWSALAGYFLFLWNYAKRFGVNEHIGAVAPQYYPPQGLSLLQSGLIIDKFADKKDFAAAVLELGSLGYLEIDNRNKKLPVIKKTDQSVDNGDLTLDQKYILDGVLFGEGSRYTVESGDPEIAQRIDNKLNRINEMLYNWSVSSEQMRTNPQRSRSKFLTTTGILAAVLGIVAIITTVKFFGVDAAVLVSMGSVFVGIGVFVLLSSIRTKAYGGIAFGAMWLLVSTIGFGGILSGLHNLPKILTSPIILIPIMALLVWYFYRKVGIFTQKGIDTYRYLLGYREFMKRVEKDRIQRFLKDDPLYLDRALPYAVLFGVNKHWLKLYNELGVVQPVWYYGDMHRMDSFNHAVQSQSIAPASESGGFSGGGGFAGGGGGGGGVGSW